MKTKTRPYRVTLWSGDDVDYSHPLSDGFGIPSIVVYCPISRQLDKYSGKDEDGVRVKGINFDECTVCEYFQGLGFGQEIDCMFQID